jgi:hypothetical protein
LTVALVFGNGHVAFGRVFAENFVAPPAFIDNVKVSRIKPQIASRATGQPILGLSF